MAELEDERIVSFGYNDLGQLGVGDREKSPHEARPIMTFPRRMKVASLSAGFLHAILIDDQGQVFSWGSGR